jgi:hypothetical protein
MRFNKEGAGMRSDDDERAGEALEEVARIHPVVDRLRELLTSATVLDIRATARGYWADRRREPAPGSVRRHAPV